MRVFLHGVRRVDMTDENGRKINGFSCFISFASQGVEGVETKKQFVSDEIASACAWSPSVGKMIDLDFTPKGKVCGVRTINEK